MSTFERVCDKVLPVALMATLMGLTGGLTAGGSAGAAPAAPVAAALSPQLEAIRQAEAQALYGSPGVKPLAERKTSLISLGDSEIAGEGVGVYEPGTDGPDNWCHRSPDAAIHRTGIPADVTYNVACSGASTVNIRIGGTKQYADELVQSDNLAIKARNTRVRLILLVAGANDDIRFGPTMTDCVTRRVFFQGECYGTYQPGWQARADAMRPKVEQTVRDLKTTMADAGYQSGDYKLVLMGYPSPIAPDVEDNPDFPGWYRGGCVGYLRDAAWGRNEAVPIFERAERQAAANTGVTYLDNSRLFHGHEVCTDNTWARGLWFAGPDIFDENTTRQSFHPNDRGHLAFASCLTQLYNSGLSQASCADSASTGATTLYPGVLSADFRQLRNEGTGLCADTYGFSSRNDTPVKLWPCHGGRNQGFWYDAANQSLHTELSQDRCVDPLGGGRTSGTALVLWNCNGGGNQRFVEVAGTLRPADTQSLCVAAASAAEASLGAALVLAGCDGSAGQRWVKESAQSVRFAELKAGGTAKCLDVDGGTMTAGRAVLAWDCTGNTNQKWWRNPATGQVHSLKDPAFCLDNRGVTAAGAGMGIWRCDEARGAYLNNLRFDADADGRLVSRVSGLVATAPTGNGAITQQPVGTSAAQRWTAGASVPLPYTVIPYDAY
ncbi:ricin-type beta-trefoil lectin domain protein [Embleya sp. NPDC127516]|uniref:ricin-type beta-trefoil lectin domain protein n=1 Tax=Embleya sp. NPDC127516 TaxID=3363990 RepID=UPI0037FAD7D0